MTELVVLVPCLGRPHRIQPTLEGFQSTADCRVLFIPDPEDGADIAAIRAAGAEMLPHEGSYGVKINAGVRHTTEPLLFFGATDLVPQPGWLEAALAHMKSGARVVGVNDTISRRRVHHATHFLAQRSYCELPLMDGEPGPLCERYSHCAVDDEFAYTAIHRGVYVYAEDAIIEHLHPDMGTAPMDDVYRKGRERIRRDKQIWRLRRYRHMEQQARV